jgi:RNA polymerase sigma-70 factor, ECF subfamily
MPFRRAVGAVGGWQSGACIMNTRSSNPFNEPFLRHQKDVFAYILTLVPDRNDAADVYQQTCLALLEKQAEYDARREFFPWACGFALNEVRRFRRAHYRERMQLDDAVIESLASVQFKSASKIGGQLDLLMDCLASLPADKRETLMHCYAHRGPMKDLAARLGLDANALYKRLERTRRLLIECMEKTK